MTGHRRCRIIQHAENHICVIVHRIYDTRHTRCEKRRIAHESEACAFPVNPVEALRHRDSGTHAETRINHIKRHRISECITSVSYTHLDRLMDLRATLDRNIHLLQLRAAKPGDLSVHRVRLPRQVCFCRRYQCTDAKDAAIKLRDTYIAAARTGKMSMGSRMFTVRAGSSCKELDLLCCIPVSEDFVGEERMEFAEMSALCIYYRGAYEGINTCLLYTSRCV